MPPGPAGHRRRSDPPDAVARLRSVALDAQALLLTLDPVLGEPQLQGQVDRFVEQAADALRALAERATSADDTRSGASRW